MNRPIYDVAIAGGGLAGALTGAILHKRCPNLRIAIVDKGESGRSGHTWSFHESDLSTECLELLSPLVSCRWPGYHVKFSDHSRRIDLAYCSIRSEDFWKSINLLIPKVDWIYGQIEEVLPQTIALKDANQINAHAVLDARGVRSELFSAEAGWQKFIGFEIKTSDDHNILEPIIMDATVDQTDGFRFFYVLPFSSKHLLIEDTYYSDRKSFNRDAIEASIEKYIHALGIKKFEIVSKESGSLPIPLGAKYLGNMPATPAIGMRGGFFHPTTGYSLPNLVRCAENLAQAITTYQYSRSSLDSLVRTSIIQSLLESVNSAKFLIRLNRMLFRATDPEKRWRVLSRFYRKKLPVISDFYSGRLSLTTKMAMISGVPPVPVFRGIRHFIGTSKPLVHKESNG